MTVVSDRLTSVKPSVDHRMTVLNDYIINDRVGKIACQLVSALSLVARRLTATGIENWIGLAFFRLITMYRTRLPPTSKIRSSRS
jgi:hypothetical protein